MAAHAQLHALEDPAKIYIWSPPCNISRHPRSSRRCARRRSATRRFALAFELLILAALRTTELLRAEWTEFDLDAAVWSVPGRRMKRGCEHRVPLSARACESLRLLHTTRQQDPRYVFPGRKPRKPVSNMALLMVLRRLKGDDITVHGFRSCFATGQQRKRMWRAPPRHGRRDHDRSHDFVASRVRRGTTTSCQPIKSRRIVSRISQLIRARCARPVGLAKVNSMTLSMRAAVSKSLSSCRTSCSGRRNASGHGGQLTQLTRREAYSQLHGEEPSILARLPTHGRRHLCYARGTSAQSNE